jgi:hypothetical protein
LEDPTPTAIPSNLLSNRCIIPQCSAQSLLMMVAYAPESTNA